MPVTPTYPGVYIEEVPSGVRPITGVATSIAAFIDRFQRGPLNEAIRIFNFGDFERDFGGLASTSEASYAIQQFFLNGGSDAYVVRVGSGDGADPIAPAAVVLSGGGTDLLTVRAGRRLRGQSVEDPGIWGNFLRLEVDYATVAPNETIDPGGVQDPGELFNLTITEIALRDGRMLARSTEKFRNLTLRDDAKNYAVNVVNEDSKLVQLEAAPGLTDPFPRPDASGTLGDELTGAMPNDGDKFEVTLDPGGITLNEAELKLGGATVQSYASLRPLFEAALRKLQADAALSAEQRPLLAGATVLLENNRFRVLLGRAGPNFPAAATLKFANGTVGTVADDLGLSGAAIVGKQMIALADGNDGPEIDSDNLIGSRADKSGLYALEDADLFNILCIPAAAARGDNGRAVYSEAEAYCLERRAFLIVDIPQNTDSLDDMQTWLAENEGLRHRNAAVYFPRVRVADPLQQNRLRSIAASGTIAGLYARTDGSRGVWKAPAGTEAGLRGVQELDYLLTDSENGVLNPLGINCLRNFPVFANISWGARTLDGADQQASEWKYTPIRRLALFIEETLYRGTKWVVFEPNDEPLWAQIRLNIGAFMQRLFRQGAFQGRTAREAYLVKCDSETTTPADIDLGVVNIVVAFAPLKPAEFVIIRIQQLAGQSPT